METISRLIGMFPPHQQLQVRLQLSTILRAVISQRLVRTSGGGRCAACEVMIHSEFIKDLIADPHRTHEIPQVIAQGQTTYGTQTFDQALYRLWKQRRISDQEALQNATNPADLKMKFEGIGNM
jgi:twitching motility protein PilT